VIRYYVRMVHYSNLFDLAELFVVRISFICSTLYSWLRIASLGGFA
jgi:hypothetical protein